MEHEGDYGPGSEFWEDPDNKGNYCKGIDVEVEEVDGESDE